MINGLIKHVQIALKNLNIFPYLCVIDGIFSEVLTKSIHIFQKQYNESTDLRYDGQNNLTALVSLIVININEYLVKKYYRL